MKNETARPPLGKKEAAASKQGHKLINLAESTSSGFAESSAILPGGNAASDPRANVADSPSAGDLACWALEKRIAALDVEIERRQS